MRSSRSSIPVLFGGLALALTACAPAPVPTTDGHSPPAQDQTPEVRQAPQDVSTPAVYVTNEIAISVTNPRIEGDQAMLDVCYGFPGPGQWLINGISLNVNGSPATMLGAFPIRIADEPTNGTQLVTTFIGTETTEQIPAGTDSKASRCDTLKFASAVSEAPAFTFTLSIQALRSSPREGQECQTYLTTIQALIDAKAPGIRIACSQEDWGANVTIVDHPPTMTLSDAEGVVFDPSLFKVSGPWLFTGQFLRE